MNTALVVVESPAKAKTLNRYLGSNFKVLASYGHVRDLLPKSGAVDPEKDFEMRYEIIEKNARCVDAIAKALKKADVLYLATDPDREGEAISWHLCELLKERKALGQKEVKRVVFHEVTKSAIREAMDNPKDLSRNLIDAQQARRALDYLVGFNLSPLLWRKLHAGLSAGRVQSPALRMIVEREEEIKEFKTREYWTIEADLNHEQADFPAKLVRFGGEKVEQFSITNEEQARKVVSALKEQAQGALIVSKVEKKQRKRQPAPPFTTSTLQQEAARKLGFTTQKTMRTAQQLYEGVDVGEGAVGLITYMRTDSVSLATEAIAEMRKFIGSFYGAKALPKQPRRYKTKSKNAQEAHEAVRPTSVYREPKTLRAKLSSDQFRLYELIWKRAVASQMAHGLIDTVAVDLACGEQCKEIETLRSPENEPGLFRANGATVVEKGFMVLYQEGTENEKSDKAATKERKLPPLAEGDRVRLREIRPEQHFTEPPPRFSEASLVKSLEEYGIGRPSTYASIISTLKNREYVEMDNKRFVPTAVGGLVNKFLTEHFTDYVDYDFTAKLEDELDAVSRGEKAWIPLMRDFWAPFSEKVKDKGEGVSRSEASAARILGKDPATGRPVSVRVGRYGPYAQLGVKDDPEKPRFASLRPEQRMDSITLEEALELFKLPRELGESDEGEKISVHSGRYGPYVRYGDKFVSLEEGDDPCTVDLERALELMRAKKKADAEKEIKVFKKQNIAVLNGRYGPYVTDGKKNAKIPKSMAPDRLTLEDCQALIAKAPAPRNRRRGRKTA